MSKLHTRIYEACRQRKVLLSAAVAVVCFSSPVFAVPYWHWVPGSPYGLANDPTNGINVINQVDIQTNLTKRVSITANGRIFISPVAGASWSIPGSQSSWATMQVQGGNYSGFASYTFQTGDWGQNIQSVVLRPLTVSYVVNWAGTDTFWVAGAGWIYSQGHYIGSDRNLKTNINNISGALDKVMRLQGVTFQRKDPKPCAKCSEAIVTRAERRTEMGLIAQDVERVVPEVVRTVGDGTKAVAYQNLVALLVEAIKTQQGQLDSQARAIKTLQSQILQRR